MAPKWRHLGALHSKSDLRPKKFGFYGKFPIRNGIDRKIYMAIRLDLFEGHNATDYSVVKTISDIIFHFFSLIFFMPIPKKSAPLGDIFFFHAYPLLWRLWCKFIS